MKKHVGYRVLWGMPTDYIDFILQNGTMKQLSQSARVCARLLDGDVVEICVFEKRQSKKHV